MMVMVMTMMMVVVVVVVVMMMMMMMMMVMMMVVVVAVMMMMMMVMVQGAANCEVWISFRGYSGYTALAKAPLHRTHSSQKKGLAADRLLISSTVSHCLPISFDLPSTQPPTSSTASRPASCSSGSMVSF